MTAMLPIKTDETISELGAPSDWETSGWNGRVGECKTLPVFIGDGWFQSFWKPTWKDRLKILFGKPIALAVIGRTHPPVSISVSDKVGAE